MSSALWPRCRPAQFSASLCLFVAIVTATTLHLENKTENEHMTKISPTDGKSDDTNQHSLAVQQGRCYKGLRLARSDANMTEISRRGRPYEHRHDVSVTGRQQKGCGITGMALRALHYIQDQKSYTMKRACVPRSSPHWLPATTFTKHSSVAPHAEGVVFVPAALKLPGHLLVHPLQLALGKLQGVVGDRGEQGQGV